MSSSLSFARQQALTLFAVVGLAAGVAAWAAERDRALAVIAYAVIGVVIIVVAIDMVRDLLTGHWGLDILAVTAMVATLWVQEYLAGLIIALMLTGGEALEAWASHRASRELDLLLRRAPVSAQRIDPATGEAEQVAVEQIAVGDRILVRSSEVLPVDGILLSAHAVIDESSVTGEPIPVSCAAGDQLLAGTVNGTVTLTMVATRSAQDSQYAAIVQLVASAVTSRAPMVRLADRYAVPFTIGSLLLAGLAWYLGKDPVRFAEVLVVATPCPLLIAAPVAFIGGMSAAARQNVIVKDGGALEQLARVRAAAFDKTGTLTQGRPEVVEIRPFGRSAEDVLRIAAAAEQHSMHVFAQPISDLAGLRQLTLPQVESASEVATNGVEATLSSGARVRVGKPAFIEEVTGPVERATLGVGETAVYLSVDEELAGVLVLSDPVRPQAVETIARMRDAGVSEIALISGDVRSTAESVAREVGISTIHAETTPQMKVDIVRSLRPRPVLMVGDGINDAPVLAVADVGIAMAGRGATVASESASAVVTSDDLGRVADVMDIARRTVTIALQSIGLGIGVSVVLMVVAAFGHLPAVTGALLQEVTDLLALVSALRALYPPRRSRPLRRPAAPEEVGTPSGPGTTAPGPSSRSQHTSAPVE